VRSDASTVAEYASALPADRRETFEAVRGVILEHLPDGFVETMEFGSPSYVVPLERYPDTYNGHPLPLASLASQKRHLALYLMGVYGDEGTATWFRERWAETGKRLDMGKSCVRFRRLDDLPLDLVGEAIGRLSLDEFVALYERSRA
jgi:uncharacterized protein DUF1801